MILNKENVLSSEGFIGKNGYDQEGYDKENYTSNKRRSLETKERAKELARLNIKKRELKEKLENLK